MKRPGIFIVALLALWFLGGSGSRVLQPAGAVWGQQMPPGISLDRQNRHRRSHHARRTDPHPRQP